MGYDTIFNLSDFYVTPLIFRHILFKHRPCIPLAFFLSTSVNVKNATFVAEEIPKLVSKKITIVTERENTVFNGIGKLLPNIYSVGNI